MANGLRCWDAAGNLTLDITDRITRQVGAFSTGTSSGSVALPATGDIWFSVIDSVSLTNASPTQPPTVTISGSTISWSWASSSYANRAATIVYGVY